jgi:hypothetical protein
MLALAQPGKPAIVEAVGLGRIGAQRVVVMGNRLVDVARLEKAAGTLGGGCIAASIGRDEAFLPHCHGAAPNHPGEHAAGRAPRTSLNLFPREQPAGTAPGILRLTGRDEPPEPQMPTDALTKPRGRSANKKKNLLLIKPLRAAGKPAALFFNAGTAGPTAC